MTFSIKRPNKPDFTSQLYFFTFKKMSNILIISGHTDLKASVANKTILEVLEKELPNARIERLDTLYPDFKIDVKKEQENLLWANIIVLQFPVFWYSAPSILERWMEESFQHGFSHGSKGDKLKGKKLILSFTTGAPAEMYHKDGAMKYEIEDFLPCYKAMCNLTGMEYCGYIFTGCVGYTTRFDQQAIEKQKVESTKHAERLIELIKKLQNQK